MVTSIDFDQYIIGHPLKLFFIVPFLFNKVHIPTGGYVDFKVGSNWINIYLYASSDDWYSTLGLCGTFDGDKSNDFTFRDAVTRTTAQDNVACGDNEDACKFAEEWRSVKITFVFVLIITPLILTPVDMWSLAL